MNETTIALVVALWVLTGLLTGLGLARRGHSGTWTVVAVLLGPLFVPIALERIASDTRAARAAAAEPTPPRPHGSGTQVLVGLDASAAATRVLDTAVRLLGPGSELTLATVVSYEASADEDDETAGSATRRLAELAADLEGVPVRFEVLAGRPGEALRQYAEQQGMDLIVVGRRGRGRAGRTGALLGRISTDLVHHSTVPVLVVEPAPPGEEPPTEDDPARPLHHGRA